MTKKILLVRPFGTSDMYYDNQIIKDNHETGETFLSITEKIAKNYEQEKSHISFPMLDAFIREINPKPGTTITLKGMFTQQDPLHRQDTIYVRDIVQKHYKKHPYVTFARNHIILPEARVLQTIFEKISEALKNSNDDIFDEIYLVPTGGTKGMTSALILAGLEQCDLKKLHLWYGEQQTNNQTYFIKQNSIKITQQTKFVARLLQERLYDGVIRYIQEEKLEPICSQEYYFAQYMNARLNADYDTALKISRDHGLPQWTRYCDPTNESFSSLEEKINGIIYTWRMGRYVEFLGRIYNFSDSISYDILCHHFGCSSLTNKICYEIVEKNQALKNFLNNYTVRNSPLKRNYTDPDHCLDRDGFVGNYIKIAIIAFLSQTNDQFNKIKTILTKLELVNNYRNSTVIAHGNDSVTKEKIIEKYGGDTIEQDFVGLLKLMTNKESLWIDKSWIQ